MYNANTARSLTMKRAYFQKDIDETLVLSSQHEAKETFAASIKQLLVVNNWQKLSAFLNPGFVLHDKNGNEAERNAQKGDWISMHTTNGLQGWMLVQDIIYRAEGINSEFMLLQLRASYALTEDIIHNIILSRDSDTITASYYHEIEARNTIILPFAADTQYAEDIISWKELIRSIIETE